jgi:hypothetical protein
MVLVVLSLTENAVNVRDHSTLLGMMCATTARKDTLLTLHKPDVKLSFQPSLQQLTLALSARRDNIFQPLEPVNVLVASRLSTNQSSILRVLNAHLENTLCMERRLVTNAL